MFQRLVHALALAANAGVALIVITLNALRPDCTAHLGAALRTVLVVGPLLAIAALLWPLSRTLDRP